MMRALAMRLFHLGLSASVVGDMSAPAVGPGDLLIASAGPGQFNMVMSFTEAVDGSSTVNCIHGCSTVYVLITSMHVIVQYNTLARELDVQQILMQSAVSVVEPELSHACYCSSTLVDC